MCNDLLARLEEEKGQWLHKAMDRFKEEFTSFDEQTVLTPENQIMQMKSIHRQNNLDLDRMEKEIKLTKDSIKEEEQVYQHLTKAVQYLQEDIIHYEGLLSELVTIQLEKFNCLLHTKFEFDSKKDQVVFKDRKTTRLIEGFNEVESEMAEFYRKQLDDNERKLARIFRDAAPETSYVFQSNPQASSLSLKHGRGLDQYIVLKNFEEDYRIVADTLDENNMLVYEYYINQLNHVKQIGKRDLLQQSAAKKEQHQMASEKAAELQEQKRQKELSLAALEEQLTRAIWEQNQELERLQNLDEFLKEEFVEAVSKWQVKLFGEQTPEVERWLYHQYSQLILKQAERIIGNEHF
ncbi:hypothetical protein ACFPA1_19535 [Neobacillus sp. GCM10023253]|uniref:hypothetical protein n=1 Tax=Neobacillus sp. GCM10023253 TaxID=3252644 RepID=UPI003608003C